MNYTYSIEETNICAYATSHAILCVDYLEDIDKGANVCAMFDYDVFKEEINNVKVDIEYLGEKANWCSIMNYVTGNIDSIIEAIKDKYLNDNNYESSIDAYEVAADMSMC